MRVRAVLALLGVLLAAPLVLSPAVRAEEDPDAGQREAARAAVLIPWSQEAKTSTLGLSASATEFLDLWLDFCRSKHAKRTKESVQFQGVPHAEWGEEDEEELLLRVAFVNLDLARAKLAEDDAPALFDAVISDGFARAVGVDGDEDRWLRLWGVMLTTQIADRRADLWAQEALTQARERVRDHLLDTLPRTGPFGEGTVRVGSLESERLVWLLGIRAAACDRAGELLTQVCAKLREGGSDKCARATSAILAGCPGPEAEAFVIEELDSGDWERQRTVLSGAGRHATPGLLERVAALAKTVETDERAQMAFVVLQRAAGQGGLYQTEAAATLRALMGELPEHSERKTMAAMALVQSENASPEVVAWLEAFVARLAKNEAHPGRIKFLERVIERARSQIEADKAAEIAAEEADG